MRIICLTNLFNLFGFLQHIHCDTISTSSTIFFFFFRKLSPHLWKVFFNCMCSALNTIVRRLKWRSNTSRNIWIHLRFSGLCWICHSSKAPILSQITHALLVIFLHLKHIKWYVWNNSNQWLWCVLELSILILALK